MKQFILYRTESSSCQEKKRKQIVNLAVQRGKKLRKVANTQTKPSSKTVEKKPSNFTLTIDPIINGTLGIVTKTI